MRPALLLARLLADPGGMAGRVDDWTAVLTAARAENLIGTLAHRLAGSAVPDRVAVLLGDARDMAAAARETALWEAEMAWRALRPLGVPVVLLKGTAFVAADLPAGAGRTIGDLDILVARADLDAVEAALLRAGWEWVKPDPYDDEYYRRWMHELPPLIHPDRDRMIDVHHTILPLTARQTPDAGALVAGSVALPSGLRVLGPADMIVHAAAHLLADGDLAGGMRNLWDIDRLLRAFAAADVGFWEALAARVALHGLSVAVRRAVRLSAALYATPVPDGWRGSGLFERLALRRLLARDGWGRGTRREMRLAFYVRSHWLRMPPAMLARHLWVKWRR